MQLNAKCYGSSDNPPLVILHGLFGSLNNWAGQSSVLAEHFQVWTLDLRNHGRSDWDDTMSYTAMSDDLLQFLDQQQFEAQGFQQIRLLGHSMGGKVAMQFALDHPDRLSHLVVVDIAPVRYPPNHDEVFSGLNSIDLTTLSSRGEADKQLQQQIPDPSVRQFLLTNLYRDGQHFAWRMNLSALQQQYDQIAAAPQSSNAPYRGPTLFIKGERSDYIQPHYRDSIETLFPTAQARVMAGVGHWPHAEKPKAFNALVSRFLSK